MAPRGAAPVEVMNIDRDHHQDDTGIVGIDAGCGINNNNINGHSITKTKTVMEINDNEGRTDDVVKRLVSSRTANAAEALTRISKKQQEQAASNHQVLHCDYLVVGAGTAGMSFVDTILTETSKKQKDIKIILVDRFRKAGGHWNYSYPYVELHQTSCNYGINSMPLARNINKKGKERYDINDRATGKDVLNYYEKCLERFQSTGRVKTFFDTEYKFDESVQKHTLIVNGNPDFLEVKCKKVVTVASNVTVPSMREPLIPVHGETVRANFVPLNDAPSRVQSGKYQNYVVFGNGKSGVDAVINLLRNRDIDQSQISWICSRDVWYFIRDEMKNFWHSSYILMKMASANSVEECFLQYEKEGLMGRLDNPDCRFPQVFKGPTIDKSEFDTIRTVENVIRMGRATSIESNGRIVFSDDRCLEFNPDNTLFVDCMVDNFYGYKFPSDLQIFEPNRINLGPILTAFNVSLSAAHTAFLECNLETDQEKNDCCYFLRGDHADPVPENFIGMLYMQTKSVEKLMKIEGGQKFFMKSRTNLNSPQHHKGGTMKMMWKFYGPKQMHKFGSKLIKKIESKGFSDVDHCFGIESFNSQAK